MPEFIEDDITWPMMVKLAGCLCTTLEERGLPGTCQCTVVPGPIAVMDACGACSKSGTACGGQAWVRLVNEFPSSRFPQPDTTSAKCGSPMAYVLEVGVARCLPQPPANGISGMGMVPVEDLVAATRLQMADKAAMKAAIQCCLDERDSDLTYVLGQYQPMQATGDCGGGTWTVTIWSM